MSGTRNLPAIMYETGPEESALIGTRDQLAVFARSILDRLDEIRDESDYHGVAVRFLAPGNGLTESLGDIAIDGIVVVASESDRRKLLNAIRTNNGEEPIDWNSRDKLHRTA